MKIIEKFGFNRKRMPPSLSLALGTVITSPLEMAMGYSVFANGGFKITPHIIKEIRNSQESLSMSPPYPWLAQNVLLPKAIETTKGPEVKEAKEAKADRIRQYAKTDRSLWFYCSNDDNIRQRSWRE